MMGMWLFTAVVFFYTTTAASVDLELPSLQGDRFFNLAEEQGRIVIINFWDTECTFCIREMPLLVRFAISHPDVCVLGVSMSPRNQAMDFIETHPTSYLQLAGPTDPSALLRRLSDPSGALPHTAILRRDHSLCATKTGEIDQFWLYKIVKQCW